MKIEFEGKLVDGQKRRIKNEQSTRSPNEVFEFSH